MSRTLKLSRSNIEEALEEDASIDRVLSQLRRLDKDGNEELSLAEVAACVKELVESEKQRKLLKSMVIAMFVLLLLFAAAIVGLTYAIVDLSKDTKVTNNILAPKDGGQGSFLSTGTVSITHSDPVSSLLSLTAANITEVKALTLSCGGAVDCGSAGPSAVKAFYIDSVLIYEPGKTVIVTTASGQVAVADSEVGLQVFANSTEATEFLSQGSSSTRRKLLQTSVDGSLTTSGGTSTSCTSGSTTTSPVPGAVIASVSGIGVTFDIEGSRISTTNGVPSTDIALASLNGAVAAQIASSSDYGSPHIKQGLTDGRYGNSNSWMGALSETRPWIAFTFLRMVNMTGFAWSRDNTGVYKDRALGTYRFQYSLMADPTLSNTGDPTTGWAPFTSIRLETVDAWGSLGSDYRFDPHLRHAFKMDSPLGVRSLRIITDSGIVIDEFEVMGLMEPPAGKYASPPPPPPPAKAGATVSQGPLTITLGKTTDSSTINVAWKGSFMASGTTVPDNAALASRLAVVNASSEYGSPHFAQNAINGYYGNSYSWIPAGETNPWIFVTFEYYTAIQKISWGRDSTGRYTDRSQGKYIIYYTWLDPSSLSKSPLITGDPSTGWIRMFDVTYPPATADFNPSIKNTFALDINGLPITAKAIRIDPPSSACIDEIEVVGSNAVNPMPPSPKR